MLIPKNAVHLNPDIIEVKAKKLAEVGAALKLEFFGSDLIIDRILKSINAWYTFPEIIERPVIVNLWGLTGVGKTHMVRRLAHLLEFGDRFVEVQMDGISSNDTGYGGSKTICSLLASSSIDEGLPGILLLDEAQRYRTIDAMGNDIKIERYQDVWMLLSDGQFAADSSLFRELESMLAYAVYSEAMAEQEKKEAKDSTKPSVSLRPPMLYPSEALKFKKILRLTEPVPEIMAMSPSLLMEKVNQLANERVNLQRDYSKLLIFVSGNLDEAFGDADASDDCDTDADVYYQHTLRVTVTDIKKALQKRFKPEQISRFGNNHIIYPSMQKQTYQALINATCNRYMTSMERVSGISFTLDEESKDVIYQNSVYPVQGTRPVFSSIHTIFSDGLVQMAFWGIKTRTHKVHLSINQKRQKLIGEGRGGIHEVDIILDIDAFRKKASVNFKTMVAAHEAGHALIFALLTHRAPEEVKINTGSFTGGYMVPGEEDLHHIMSRQEVLDTVAGLYAGRCAEALVFGPDHVSIGAASDLRKATLHVSDYVRLHGFDSLAGVEKAPTEGHDVHFLIPEIQLNKTINGILVEQKDRATQLLIDNKGLYVRLVDRLLQGTTLTKQEFKDLFPELDLSSEKDQYIQGWKKFRQ